MKRVVAVALAAVAAVASLAEAATLQPTDRPPLPCAVAPRGQLLRRSDGIASFEVSAHDTTFAFRSDQPYDTTCTDEELRIVPRPGAQLAPVAFRWRTGAFALATDVAAEARKASDGLAPQAALDALAPWRRTLDAVQVYGDRRPAGIDEAVGAVVLLQASAWERIGRFDLARDAFEDCSRRYPAVAAAMQQALRAQDARANPGLALTGLKRIGSLPRSVHPTLPTDDAPCNPVVFWAPEGLCVAQGTEPPFARVRCHAPETGKWGKAIPVRWPERRYQCSGASCFPCSCASADDRLDAPSDSCRSVSFRAKPGEPPHAPRGLAHTAKASYFTADRQYLELVDGAIRPTTAEAVLAGAAASAGGSAIVAGRFSCAAEAGTAGPGRLALLCAEVRHPGTEFAVSLDEVTPRPESTTWTMRPLGSPDGRFVALLFEPGSDVEADPVLILARVTVGKKEER